MPLESEERTFSFIIPEKKGTIFLSTETYYEKAISKVCFTDPELKKVTRGKLTYQNGQNIRSSEKMDLNPDFDIFRTVEAADNRPLYEAGDNITISVTYNWRGQAAARDFSVVVYSAQDIEIFDQNGNTN